MLLLFRGEGCLLSLQLGLKIVVKDEDCARLICGYQNAFVLVQGYDRGLVALVWLKFIRFEIP